MSEDVKSENTQQMPEPSEQKDVKPERIDELDVLGAFLFSLAGRSYNRIKQLFTPSKVE